MTEKMMARPGEGGAQKARAELHLRGRVALRSLLTFHHTLLPSPVPCRLGCQHTEQLPPWHVYLRATHRLVCLHPNLTLNPSKIRSIRGKARIQPHLQGSKQDSHWVEESWQALHNGRSRVLLTVHRVPSPSQVTPSKSLSW